MPELKKAYEKLKDRKVLFLGVTNVAPSYGFDPKETMEELGINYPVINFSDDFFFIVSDNFVELPTSFIVGNNGEFLVLAREEYDRLCRHMREDILSDCTEPKDLETAEKYRELLDTPELLTEETSMHLKENGAFTISGLSCDLLTDLIESLLSGQ